MRYPLGTGHHVDVSLDGQVILTTDRLVLRRMRQRDARIVAAYRNDPDIARYQGWDVPCTVDEVAEWLTSFMRLPWPALGSAMNLAIELDGEVIGDVAVGWDDTGDEAWIGFTLQRDHHGQGYATEATSAMVDLLIAQGTSRVTASVDPANQPSIRVLERVGFSYTGSTRALIRGEWVDDDTYALTSAEH